MKLKFQFFVASLFSFVILFVSFTSCGVSRGSSEYYNLMVDSVEIGMTQQEVVAILGDKYINMSTSQSEDGILRVISYYANDRNYLSYNFYFVDNHLVEWVREYDAESAGRDRVARANWSHEQDRQKEFKEMKELKEREVKALEEANKKKEGAK